MDYLGIDLLPEDDKHAKKARGIQGIQSGKGASCVNSYGSYTGVSSAFLLYTDRQWPAVAAMGAALICLNQHRIGHRLMKKNLIADVKSAFPKWLMDLAY